MIEFTIIGNLGADAIMNNDNGRQIINFAVCHSQAWKNREENRDEKKYWVDCAYFLDSPELVNLLRKGMQVYVKGTPDIGIHIKKGTNEPVAIQYLRVSKIEILSKKKKEELIKEP